MFSGFELGRTVFTGAPLTGLCCRPEVGCPPNGCAAAAPNASRNASSGGGGGGGCVPKDNPCRAAFELYHQWYDERGLCCCRNSNRSQPSFLRSLAAFSLTGGSEQGQGVPAA